MPQVSALAGDGAYCVERLYTLNEEPYIHFRHYIPSSINLPNDPNVFVNSLYDMLYQEGIRFFSGLKMNSVCPFQSRLLRDAGN